jgi:hypothetical protein
MVKLPTYVTTWETWVKTQSIKHKLVFNKFTFVQSYFGYIIAQKWSHSTFLIIIIKPSQL